MDIFNTKELISVFSEPIQVIFLLSIATILGLLVSWVYNRTHRGFSYSQSFNVTLVIMSTISTLIIIVIGDNLARAVGLFGAFSIIRFRTAVKDARDTAFMFFVLAIGLAVGTGSIQIGVAGTIFISALIFILHFLNFGGIKKLDYILNFRMDSKDHAEGIFKILFKKYLKSHNLLNVETKEKGKYMVFTFNISLKNQDLLKEFLDKMHGLKGITEVNVVSSKYDLVY